MRASGPGGTSSCCTLACSGSSRSLLRLLCEVGGCLQLLSHPLRVGAGQHDGAPLSSARDVRPVVLPCRRLVSGHWAVSSVFSRCSRGNRSVRLLSRAKESAVFGFPL